MALRSPAPWPWLRSPAGVSSSFAIYTAAEKGVPWISRAGKGGFAPLSQDTVFSFACLRSTSLGGVGQLVGDLFPNSREAEPVGTRKNSDLGSRTEFGGSRRRWGVGSQSLESGLWRSRSGARRICLSCCLSPVPVTTPFPW